VNREQDEIWRQGLRARGRDWVMAELHLRAGRPEDVLLEVVFEPPYPTRAFCRQWCAAEESKVRVHPSLRLALVVAALAVICVGKAVTGWEDLAAEQEVEANLAAPGPVAAPPAGDAVGVTNDIPAPVTTAPDSAVPTVAPSLNADLSTICLYQSYASAACPAQQ